MGLSNDKIMAYNSGTKSEEGNPPKPPGYLKKHRQGVLIGGGLKGPAGRGGSRSIFTFSLFLIKENVSYQEFFLE